MILIIYVVLSLIIGFFSVRLLISTNEVDKSNANDVGLAFMTISAIWPVVVAVLLFLSPFYLVGRLLQKIL